MLIPNPAVRDWKIEDWEQYVYPDPVPEELSPLRRVFADRLMRTWKDMLEILKETPNA